MANQSEPQSVTTPTIVVYRKASNVSPVKCSAKQSREQRAAIETRSRVKRDALLDHFTPKGSARSDFHKQEAVPPVVIDNPQRRNQEFPDAGWIIPDDCLGRTPKSGEHDWSSTAQSILLWIKQTIVAAGWCDASELSVVVEYR